MTAPVDFFGSMHHLFFFFFRFQAMYILIILGFLFLPVYVSSGVSFKHENTIRLRIPG